MGQGLGRLYIQLVEELFALNMKWICYSLLFRVSEERVVLLNENLSGMITSVIQDSMLDSVILSVAYLVDTPKDAFKLERFRSKLKESDAGQELQHDLDDLISFTKDTVKDLRDNHLAHHNYSIYSSEDRSYKYPVYGNIDKVCEMCHDFTNALALRYRVPPFTCHYKTYELKVESFFCKLTGEKLTLKRLSKKRSEWEHLRPLLYRFFPQSQVIEVEQEETEKL